MASCSSMGRLSTVCERHRTHPRGTIAEIATLALTESGRSHEGRTYDLTGSASVRSRTRPPTGELRGRARHADRGLLRNLRFTLYSRLAAANRPWDPWRRRAYR
jgi:hypothetical protein